MCYIYPNKFVQHEVKKNLEDVLKTELRRTDLNIEMSAFKITKKEKH